MDAPYGMYVHPAPLPNVHILRTPLKHRQDRNIKYLALASSSTSCSSSSTESYKSMAGVGVSNCLFFPLLLFASSK